MTPNSTSLVLKPFDSQVDREAVAQLLSALESLGQLPGISSEQLLQLLASGGLVALHHGRCVAVASVELSQGAKEADLIWVVEPGADGARHGLLASARNRAKTLGATTALCYLPESDAENLTFFNAAGAANVTGYSRWVADLSESIEANPAEAITVQATDDAQLLLKGTEAAWSDLPGHKPATPAAVDEAIAAFGPGMHFIALDDSGQPIGLFRGLMVGPQDAYVDAPGLAPRFRTAENYSHLTKLAMQHLSRLGAKTAVMDSWGDVPEAWEGWLLAGWTRQSYMPARRITIY